MSEPFDLEKEARSIAEIKLKDPELQYTAVYKCVVDYGRRCWDAAIAR